MEWSIDDMDLVVWFRCSTLEELPKAPFVIKTDQVFKIADGRSFYDGLTQEIKSGCCNDLLRREGLITILRLLQIEGIKQMHDALIAEYALNGTKDARRKEILIKSAQLGRKLTNKNGVLTELGGEA